MGAILTIAVKDLKLLIRDKSGFFFTFFFPLIIAILFGSIFGGGGGGTRTMTVLMVDQDSTEVARKFIKTLNDASEINVVEATLDTARRNVRKGKYVAYLMVKEGFGEAYERMFWGEPPELEIGVDPSRKAEAAMLQGILMKYGAKRFQEMFTNPTKMVSNLGSARQSLEEDTLMDPKFKNNLMKLFSDVDEFYSDSTAMSQPIDSTVVNDSALAEGGDGFSMEPLKITKSDIIREKIGPANSYEVSFPQGIIWGIIGVAAAFGISIVVERTTGTLHRLRIAPIGITHLLAGKALACMISTMAISTILMLVGFFIFKVTVSSLLFLVVVILSVSVAFTGIMMLLSVLGKTERSVSGIGWAVLLVMSMMGGGMIPMMFMPGWMLKVGSWSPVKWSILAFEGVIWRGFSAAELVLPCAILISIGVVAFTIGTAVFKRMELA